MTSFVTITCRCGVKFGLLPGTDAHLRMSSQEFFCPFGHSCHWPQGETEETKLRRERDRLKQEAARLEESIAYWREAETKASRRVSAMKGQVTKLKTRAAAGVCPCCNRSFENLRRHMASKHAGFTVEAVQAEVGQTIQ